MTGRTYRAKSLPSLAENSRVSDRGAGGNPRSLNAHRCPVRHEVPFCFRLVRVWGRSGVAVKPVDTDARAELRLNSPKPSPSASEWVRCLDLINPPPIGLHSRPFRSTSSLSTNAPNQHPSSGFRDTACPTRRSPPVARLWHSCPTASASIRISPRIVTPRPGNDLPRKSRPWHRRAMTEKQISPGCQIVPRGETGGGEIQSCLISSTASAYRGNARSFFWKSLV